MGPYCVSPTHLAAIQDTPDDPGAWAGPTVSKEVRLLLRNLADYVSSHGETAAQRKSALHKGLRAKPSVVSLTLSQAPINENS